MMDIGEHPGCLAKDVYAITNADSVKLYKNDKFIKEFTKENSPFKHLPHGPILIDDFLGEIMEKEDIFKDFDEEDNEEFEDDELEDDFEDDFDDFEEDIKEGGEF